MDLTYSSQKKDSFDFDSYPHGPTTCLDPAYRNTHLEITEMPLQENAESFNDLN